MGMGLLGMGSNACEEEEETHGQSSTSAEGRRKSLRACKGKRYQEFMSTGRLATGKRIRSHTATSNERYASYLHYLTYKMWVKLMILKFPVKQSLKPLQITAFHAEF